MYKSETINVKSGNTNDKVSVKSEFWRLAHNGSGISIAQSVSRHIVQTQN